MKVRPRSSPIIGQPRRQGDVMPTPVDAIPTDAVALPLAPGKRVVLAMGEATGHAHAIAIANEDDADVVMLRDPRGGEWLDVRRPVTVRHEEHDDLPLEPGLYCLPMQVEDDGEEERRLRD